MVKLHHNTNINFLKIVNENWNFDVFHKLFVELNYIGRITF